MTITSHTALKPKMVGKSLLLETSTKSVCIKFRISISVLSEVKFTDLVIQRNHFLSYKFLIFF